MQELSVEKNFSTEPPDYRLYSSGQMVVATILCSIMSGGLLLASNYSKLGDKKSARHTVYLSIAVLILQLIISAYVLIWINPRGNAFFVGLNVVIAVCFGYMVDKWQANQYGWHRAQGGLRNSNLNAATLCLFTLCIFFALLFLLVLISIAYFFFFY